LVGAGVISWVLLASTVLRSPNAQLTRDIWTGPAAARVAAIAAAAHAKDAGMIDQILEDVSQANRLVAAAGSEGNGRKEPKEGGNDA